MQKIKKCKNLHSNKLINLLFYCLLEFFSDSGVGVTRSLIHHQKQINFLKLNNIEKLHFIKKPLQYMTKENSKEYKCELLGKQK